MIRRFIVKIYGEIVGYVEGTSIDLELEDGE